MRSGKDTLAEIFQERADFQNMKFSKGITEIIETYLPDIAKEGKNREVYQSLGQHMRTYNKNIWIDHAKKSIDWGRNVIITDVRQENEYQFAKDNGFVIIKIEADKSQRELRIQTTDDKGTTSESHKHETEVICDTFEEDYHISNNGSLEDLRRVANSIFDEITKN